MRKNKDGMGRAEEDGGPAARRMGKFILVRHGESVGNRDRRFTASPDAPMTELGRRQALEAARRLKVLFCPAVVVASPYARARETGEIIAAELGVPLEINPEFREQNLGHLAGQSYDAVWGDPSFDPGRSWSWRPTGGESHEDVLRRIGPVVDTLARKHEGDELVIVSHGGVMRSIWAHVTGSWEDARIPPNCAIVVVEHDFGRYRAPVLIGEGER